MPETKTTIYGKIAAVQGELRPITKDKTNPHFKNAYFDISDLIAAVKPLALKHGLTWLQPLTVRDGKNVLLNIVADIETGTTLEWATYLPDIADPQKMVALVTYFKRITGTALWLVEGEADDDGNTAAAPTRQFDSKPAITKLNATRSLDELKNAWASLTPAEMNHAEIQAAKEAMKFALSEDSVDADA